MEASELSSVLAYLAAVLFLFVLAVEVAFIVYWAVRSIIVGVYRKFSKNY